MRGSLYMLINRPSVHICIKMLVILVLGREDDMFVVVVDMRVYISSLNVTLKVQFLQQKFLLFLICNLFILVGNEIMDGHTIFRGSSKCLSKKTAVQ